MEKVANSMLSSEAVEIDEISGRRLVLEFKAFGYFKRTCQLELRKNGDSIFSKGMVTREKGAWRVEVQIYIYEPVNYPRMYVCTQVSLVPFLHQHIGPKLHT